MRPEVEKAVLELAAMQAEKGIELLQKPQVSYEELWNFLGDINKKVEEIESGVKN